MGGIQNSEWEDLLGSITVEASSLDIGNAINAEASPAPSSLSAPSPATLMGSAGKQGGDGVGEVLPHQGGGREGVRRTGFRESCVPAN